MFGRAGKSSYPQKSLLAELTRLANLDEEATALTGGARLSKGASCKRSRAASEGTRTLACRARSAKEMSPQASAHDGEDSRTVAPKQQPVTPQQSPCCPAGRSLHRPQRPDRRPGADHPRHKDAPYHTNQQQPSTLS